MTNAEMMPTTLITSVSDLRCIIPEDGWKWSLLDILWLTRNRPVSMWIPINQLANHFRRKGRERVRLVRLVIWKELSELIEQGWIIRHAGYIQLNPARLADQNQFCSKPAIRLRNGVVLDSNH